MSSSTNSKRHRVHTAATLMVLARPTLLSGPVRHHSQRGRFILTVALVCRQSGPMSTARHRSFSWRVHIYIFQKWLNRLPSFLPFWPISVTHLTVWRYKTISASSPSLHRPNHLFSRSPFSCSRTSFRGERNLSFSKKYVLYPYVF